MKWTNKQRAFMKGYRAALQKKNNPATSYDIAEVCIALYLEAQDDAEKERAAYSLLTVFSAESLSGFKDLLDLEEVCRHAAVKQRKVKNSAKFTHEKRHQSRGDYSLTDTEWQKALQYFQHTCAYCGKKSKLTFEHVVPFSKGGQFDRHNIIPACTGCNASKNNLDFHEWFRAQPFYEETKEQNILAYLNQNNYKQREKQQ